MTKTQTSTKTLGEMTDREIKAAAKLLAAEYAKNHSELPAGLITCEHDGCPHQFFPVPTRQFPTLCMDHAEEIDRHVNGWTPENSVD